MNFGKKDVTYRDPEQNPKGSSATGKNFTAEQKIQQTIANKSVNNQDTTLTVYQCKQKNNGCILSKLHTSVMVDTTTKKKPETVTFYNKTKCGVDIADQMTRQYTMKAGTRRWRHKLLCPIAKSGIIINPRNFVRSSIFNSYLVK